MNVQRSLSWLSQNKLQFKDLQSKDMVSGQAPKFLVRKRQSSEVVSVFGFCLFQRTPFYSALIYKKGHHTKIFFRVSTLFSDNFAPHIQNLEMYFAILVYFDFGYVCSVNLVSKLCIFSGRPPEVELIVANRLKIPHTFVIHTYTKPTQCQFCKKMLVGVFKQVGKKFLQFDLVTL